MSRIYLNNDWDYCQAFLADLVKLDFPGEFDKVRLPHTFEVTPFNAFSTDIYQKDAIYRKNFKTEPEWERKRVLLTIEGAAHKSEVYLNEKLLATHDCGYTAFTVDLTSQLAPIGQKNLLAVRVDSHEDLNQPPFGFVVDYMTYGGIYRDVYIDVKNPVYIEDVFVKTCGTKFEAEVKIGGCAESETKKFKISHTLKSAPSVKFTTDPNREIKMWSVDEPYLYVLETCLSDADGNLLDCKETRFGFRDIRYDESGFYLNGQKIKIRGLNRHQAWPYVGYAMPKNMQIEDADILKYELGLNEVRTSHYPQSQYFIDRCDEIGLLVFTEIPGWQHIGNADWKNKAVQNVRDMVLQYRNHPSIFIWGVRINESQDDDEFYERTNKIAHELDSTRPTGGVRYLKNSHLLEDVYTFNDFSFWGPNEGCLPKSKVTDTRKGYMITEYNGHMFPTKTFDCESHRTEHAIRHAKVLDAVAGHEEISGSSGWCAFDYNTHKDFGSGDYICYHGVMDMFRNPKMAAYVYQSQEDAKVSGDVLYVTSGMDIGEYPASMRGDVYIITNADSVKMYVNDIFIKEYTADGSPFKNLRHGPIVIDDYVGHRLVDEDGIKEKDLKPMKDMLFALQKYGVDNLPFRIVLKGLCLWARGVTNPNKLRDLYGKYIGNWGGKAVVYKFEAYRDGKLVKTVVRTPARSTTLKIEARRRNLVEESSYDVASVSLKAIDENGNLQPYCQEAVFLRCEGEIELIGPKLVSLKGGMAGTYVRSKGKAGKGTLFVTDWQNNEHWIEFNVELSTES